MALPTQSRPRFANSRRLFSNRSFILVWGGQTLSTFGDSFFNLAVMWVIYTQSGSALQTALVQVVWHLSSILFGPLAGTLADRWERKRIMVTANALAAIAVGTVSAVLFVQGQVSATVIFVAVFVLNSLTTFLYPARFSIMPAIVGRDLLASAAGWFAAAERVASLIGEGIAGVVVATVGAAWATIVDAVSFLVAALAVVATRLSGGSAPPARTHGRRTAVLRDVVDGWRAIADRPVVRALVWFTVLINMTSFLGPLYPALVSQRLHGDAVVYGLLNAMGIGGGMTGGALTGMLERKLGAGRLLTAGWTLSGGCVLGMAASTWLPLTVVLEATASFGAAVSATALAALTQALVPDEYLGRVSGIALALGAIAIPVSALVGGWLADLVGVGPLFAVGGAWTLGVAALVWATPRVRLARMSS